MFNIGDFISTVHSYFLIITLIGVSSLNYRVSLSAMNE